MRPKNPLSIDKFAHAQCGLVDAEDLNKIVETSNLLDVVFMVRDTFRVSRGGWMNTLYMYMKE